MSANTAVSPTSLAPLSQRVVAPPVAHGPRHRDVARWRPATIADVDAIAVMQRAIDEVDHPGWLTAREDISGDLEGAHIENARDTLLGLADDGRVVAYGLVAQAPGEGDRVQIYLLGGVHPEWRERGIGRELMRWQYERALQRLAASEARLPGWITAYREEANRSGISVALRLGLQLTRYFITMRRHLGGGIAQVPTPAGVRLVPFAEALSSATLVARNDSFRDHWGNQPKSVEMWNHWVHGEVFRADLSRVAVVDEPDGLGGFSTRVVAFSLASVNDAGQSSSALRTVHVDRIGVVRSHRGQRLAPAVIAATLGAAADAGFEHAVLEVDAENPSGANVLYERLGFVPGERLLAFVRVF